jgi:NAD(P)-dependent dehydrogenase (short-subunit alcohol dehydrogenase family)
VTPVSTPEFLRQTLRLVPLPPLAPAPPDALDGRRVSVINGSPELRRCIERAVARHGGVPVGDATAARVEVIVDLTLCGIPGDDWREPMQRTVAELLRVYPAWAEEEYAGRLDYVAVTAMGGRMGLAPMPGGAPVSGLWAGLAKTLHREIPNCRGRVVDLGAVPDAGETVFAELFGSSLVEVGATGSGRWTIVPEAAPLTGERIPVDATDVLLLTGGGRGIGFEIALEMARTTGCRVLVSGRSALPAETEPWFSADDASFSALAQSAYRERRPGETVAAVRRRVERMKQLREVRHNLARAAACGAHVDYAACDVTKPDDVARLLALAGPDLSLVVHNAGIDEPTRLVKKTPEQVMGVISVKVDGFTNLLSALGDRPLKMLCAVGSLTGRYGGMVGQVDYAAANEGLARLAAWAGHERRHSVKSLSWPTWKDLGLITNLEAAGRYMRPISREAGLEAWREELQHTGSGEIGFVSEIGELTPSQLTGLSVPSDWSGRAALLTRRFLLGEVVRYAPASRLETRHPLRTGQLGFPDDAVVGSSGTLPIAVLIEYLAAGAAWLPPPMGPLLAPTGVRELWARPRPLSGAPLVRRAVAEQSSGRWRVRVELEADGEAIAGGTFVFDADAGAEVGQPDAPPAGLPAPRRAYRWRGHLTEVEPWVSAGGSWSAEVRPTVPSDLSTMTDPPVPALPIAHLEAIIAASPGAPEAARWQADALELPAGGLPRRVLVTGAQAQVLDAEDRPVLAVTGSRWGGP